MSTLHQSMYHTVERLIDSLVPLFDSTLIDLKAPRQDQRLHPAMLGREPMIQREPGPFTPPEQRALDWLDQTARYQDVISGDLNKEFGILAPKWYSSFETSTSHPGDPAEMWHVQVQNNERIAATEHYNSSTNNISFFVPPTMSFLRRINPEEAGLAKGCMISPPYGPDIYGAEDGNPVIQRIGDVMLREGRTLVYPNTFQTRLNGFGFAGASKPGSGRILTLDLIDPNRRNMSTAMVSCHRHDWWVRETPRLWKKLRGFGRKSWRKERNIANSIRTRWRRIWDGI